MSLEVNGVQQRNITNTQLTQAVSNLTIASTFPTSNDNARSLPVDHINAKYDIFTLSSHTLSLIKDIDSLVTEKGDRILVCGDTGAGKSTLLNLLAGAKLEAIPVDNTTKLRLECRSGEVTKIGHSLVSETTIPSKVQIGSITYWDCPGFNDSRGPATDIANTLYLNTLFNTADRVKVMIVADEASINGSNRGEAFKVLVSRLGELFKNKEDWVKGLCIVFTKSRDIEDFRVEIQNIADIDPGLSPENKKLFYDIAKHSKIAIFQLPEQIGAIPEEERNHIVSQISSTEFISNPKVNITISKDTSIILSKLIEEMRQQVGDISKSLSEKVASKISVLSLPQMQAINNTLKAFASECNTPGKFPSSSSAIDRMKVSIYNPILALPNFAALTVGITQNLLELTKLAEYSDNFFKKVIPDTSIDLQKLKITSSELSSKIEAQIKNIELAAQQAALAQAQAQARAQAAAQAQALAAQQRAYAAQLAAQQAAQAAAQAQYQQQIAAQNAAAAAAAAAAAQAQAAAQARAQAAAQALAVAQAQAQAQAAAQVHHHHHHPAPRRNKGVRIFGMRIL